MARSPFQGTYRDGVRPTIVTAPDTIVYFNGQSDIQACGNCRRRFDVNKYITSVQVDLSIYNAPGSASVSMSIPRHTVDDFFVDGRPIITEMMEIEIYAKGYFLVEGLPQYYPIFWGLVTETSDSYSGGEHTFSVNCADILKWWEYCRMNTNPAFTQAAGQLGRNYNRGNVFDGMNSYDIIWTLAQQSMGDIVRATGSLNSDIREDRDPSTFTALRGDMMSYWNHRFGQMRSNLMLYGMQGAAVRGDEVYLAQSTGDKKRGQRFASQAVSQANGAANSLSQLAFDPQSVTPFRSNLQNVGNPNMFQSEYQTKLELANACKDAVGYEFYMDVTGDIVFKPPFYNLDIISNKPVSWIQDIDIIDWDFSASEAEVITHLQMQGSMDGGVMDMGVTNEATTPYTQVIDYHLLQKYGYRSTSYNAEYLSNTADMFSMGLNLLDQMNSKRHRASINIPLRPELRLGFPSYIAPRDQIWYTTGISHNIQFGGRAQTTLTLSAKREKFQAPRGIATLELTSGSTGESTDSEKKKKTPAASFNLKFNGDPAEIPATNMDTLAMTDGPYTPIILRHPKTGRVVGFPNAVTVYSRKLLPTDPNLSKIKGQNQSNKRKAEQLRNQGGTTAKQDNEALVNEGLTATVDQDLINKHLSHRYMSGMTSAGVHVYAHDISGVVLEQVMAASLTTQNESGEETVGQNLTQIPVRPVSDERGFELVGHYRYGRGVALRDGSLIVNAETGINERATVSTQIALSGGLFETLSAQSNSLSTRSTRFPNPADAAARLAPDGSDLQTAGTINPETKKPEFSSAQNNFVNVAPLHSPAQKGAPVSVEASQLSSALTLAEMRPKAGNPASEDCSCLLGRSDLAFIASGYQVEIFPGAAEDNTSLNFEDDREQDPLSDPADPNRPVSTNRTILSRTDTISKVDLFLTKLYEALDTPHQEYEAALRGKLIKGPTRRELVEGTYDPQESFSPFAPPFSAPNRAAGGDPRALAISGSSAVENIAQSWKSFGEDLRSKPKRTKITEGVARLEKTLRELKQEREDLQIALDSGSKIVSTEGGFSSRLKSNQEAINKVTQELGNEKARLSKLNNES